MVLEMNHSRFKYVSKLEHAHLLLNGSVFHQTLGYFRDYEDSEAKQVLGDEFESTRIFRPVNGLQVNNQTRATSGTVQMGFESSVRAGEIYVFCVSFAFTEGLKKEFRLSLVLRFSTRESSSTDGIGRCRQTRSISPKRSVITGERTFQAMSGHNPN